MKNFLKKYVHHYLQYIYVNKHHMLQSDMFHMVVDDNPQVTLYSQDIIHIIQQITGTLSSYI